MGRHWLGRKGPPGLEAWRVASLWGKSWFLRQKRNLSRLCPALSRPGVMPLRGMKETTDLLAASLSQLSAASLRTHVLLTGQARGAKCGEGPESPASAPWGCGHPESPAPLHAQSP